MKGTLAYSRHLPLCVCLGGQSGNYVPIDLQTLPMKAFVHPANTALPPQGLWGGVHVHRHRNGSRCCL